MLILRFKLFISFLLDVSVDTCKTYFDVNNRFCKFDEGDEVLILLSDSNKKMIITYKILTSVENHLCNVCVIDIDKSDFGNIYTLDITLNLRLLNPVLILKVTRLLNYVRIFKSSRISNNCLP